MPLLLGYRAVWLYCHIYGYLAVFAPSSHLWLQGYNCLRSAVYQTAGLILGCPIVVSQTIGLSPTQVFLFGSCVLLNVGEPGTFSRPYALGVAVSQAVEVIALSCASMSCNHHDLWRSITLKNGSPNYLFIMFGLRKYLLLRALYLLLGSEIFSSTCFISTASYHLLTLHQKEKAVGFRCGG